MKKVVLYSSNSKKRSKNSQCTVFPKWAAQWDKVAEKYADCEIILIVQLNGRYFLDIRDGELAEKPKNIKVVQMDIEAKLEDFVEEIAKINPDVAIAMPGPVSGYDWNGLRDAGIAEQLKKKGIKTICYSIKTALDTFDKWRTHQVLEANGFCVPKVLYVQHELFVAGKNDEFSTGNVYTEYILQQVKDMEKPIVIKSTTGSSSMGIHISKDYENAKKYLLSDENVEDVIVEQFIKGEEFGTEVHGCKGNYHVMPPFRIFNTEENEVNDPLGLTTVKYGPILDEKYHIQEIQKEILRLAETMEFAGTMQVDLMYANNCWYIIEINSRWSGMTTLICGTQGRFPYEIYLEQMEEMEKNYTDLENLKFACQFKMSSADENIIEQISSEPEVTSLIQYEIVRPGKLPFVFNDVVVSGFDTMGNLIKTFYGLQKKYPEQIAFSVVAALAKKVNVEL